jgi:hypothetical protein
VQDACDGIFAPTSKAGASGLRTRRGASRQIDPRGNMPRTNSFELALYHRTWRRVLAVGIAMLGMAGAIPGIAATPPVSALTLEGQLAPGMGGAKFTSFDEPAPNTSGDGVFLGDDSGGSTGVYVRRGGILAAVALSGKKRVRTLSSTFDGPA